jgi:predicted acetyltransferase
LEERYMTIDYRLMRPHEEPAVQDFFLTTYTAYPDEGLQNYRSWQCLPPHNTRTFVAVAPDQRVIATVVVWYRLVRDATGTPVRVGHLSHVATHPDVRRQGHASRLVDQAIVMMRHDGCTWSSLLTASAAGRALYQQYGWRSLGMPFWQGRLNGAASRSTDTGYTIQRYHPSQQAQAWAALAAIYIDYNTMRPLTVVRDHAYWRDYTAVQLADGLTADRVVIFTAHHAGQPDDLCGYILLHIQDHMFFVSEIGVRAGDQAASAALLAAVAEEATQRGVLKGEWMLPQTSTIAAALEDLCGDTLKQIEADFIMARPIAPDVADGHVEAIFAAPGAIWWRMDMI